MTLPSERKYRVNMLNWLLVTGVSLGIVTSSVAGAQAVRQSDAIPATTVQMGTAPLPSGSQSAAPEPLMATNPPMDGAAPTSAQLTQPSASPGVPVACFPDCRAGYVCNAGQCISACNPPCPSNQSCTEQRTCVVTQASQQPEADERTAYAEEAERLSKAGTEDTPSMRRRLAHRELPRFTLQASMQFNLPKAGKLVALALAPAVGYRQNLTPRFGIQVRLGASVGLITPGRRRNEDTSGIEDPYPRSNDSCTVTQVYGELVTFFGPFGRVYVGPLLWIGHFTYDKSFLREYGLHGELIETHRLEPESLFGTGVDGGVLLLDREQVDLNWRVKTTLSNSIPLGFEAGAAYHFM